MSKPRIDTFFQHVTTLVSSRSGDYLDHGTGFYYNELAPTEKEGPQWRKVTGTWLVTNKHLVLSEELLNGVGVPVEEFSYHIRTIVEERYLAWQAVTLTSSQLSERLLLHPDEQVDVAMIRLDDIFGGNDPKTVYGHQAIAEDDLVKPDSKVQVHTGSDVLVAGYPLNFYDEVHLHPILKSGVVASGWGLPFNGFGCILIDAKLFPGSSGSIVVSKPTSVAVHEGKLMHSTEPQISLVGVYSGAFTIEDEPDFDLGIVWPASCIPEILSFRDSKSDAAD